MTHRNERDDEDWLKSLPLNVRYAIAIVGTALVVALTVVILSIAWR